VGVDCAQREVDRGRDAVAIAEHIMVPEPHDAITLGFYGSRSVRIPRGRVLAPVHLNNQLRVVTAEINGVRQHRNLPPEARVWEA
jgi:hypothetical protein